MDADVASVVGRHVADAMRRLVAPGEAPLERLALDDEPEPAVPEGVARRAVCLDGPVLHGWVP